MYQWNDNGGIAQKGSFIVQDTQNMNLIVQTFVPVVHYKAILFLLSKLNWKYILLWTAQTRFIFPSFLRTKTILLPID